jgi:hypothetical protein
VFGLDRVRRMDMRGRGDGMDGEEGSMGLCCGFGPRMIGSP